jgi:DNA-binding transcriptional ArsR family regulator
VNDVAEPVSPGGRSTSCTAAVPAIAEPEVGLERLVSSLCGFGVGRAEARVMARLILSPTTVQSGEGLANALGIGRSTVSHAIRSLQRAGWVEKVGFSGERWTFYRVGRRFPDALILGFAERLSDLDAALEQVAGPARYGSKGGARSAELRERCAFLERVIRSILLRQGA